nr:hypothetical protein Itr_chr02CG11910 [Ipomoea trifida]GLL19693.1 hypothetical protein Itr_chr02CG11920 [Ipomoea trifida]
MRRGKERKLAHTAVSRTENGRGVDALLWQSSPSAAGKKKDHLDSPVALPVHRAPLPLIVEDLSRHCCCRLELSCRRRKHI